MKTQELLVAILLAVGLYLVPALGYGEVEQWRWEHSASYMDFSLLKGRVNYIMRNPTDFLDVRISLGRTEEEMHIPVFSTPP